jgi:diacylglycerol O-acyltransferase
MSGKTKSMSGVDSAWLHMEDPTNLMMVTGVAFLDRPVDRVRFRRMLEERLLTLDRFTMKVIEGRLPVGTPHWETDPHFDLDAHIHYIALPDPGDEAALRMLLGDLASTPIDFSKPPWQMHLVDNVMGGSAMILRFHHCVGDGAAMNYVMYRMMDAERDPAPAPPAEETPSERPPQGLLGTMFSPVTGAFNLSRKTAGFLLHEGLDFILHPSHFLERAETATDSAGVVTHMLAMPPDPQTPFKGPLGVQKHVAWSAPLALEDVKFVAQTYDAKINDVLIGTMSGALRAYLLERGAEADLEIHAVVPVDLRPPEKAHELGNRFGLVFLGLPLEIGDPIARLFEVRGRMNELKQSPEAMVFLSMLSIFGHTPQTVEDQIVNLFASRATAVLTNVAGPRETLYVAGSRINHMIFWVPQSGRMGMGISIFSYDGEVLLGVITDAGLVPDPERIATHFNAEFAALLALAEAEAGAD